jgi:hypothetical protein
MLTNSALNVTTPTQSLGYESLRLQGIAWLEQLAGSEWTDFNAHDPGITILEQLCYALTDLSYRINYEIADLLSRDGEDTYASLYRPEQILATNPVTMLDLRKLAIDVEGVKNAWFEPVAEFQPPIFVLEKTAAGDESQVFDLITGAEGATRLTVQGLYRVFMEISPIIENDAIRVQDLMQELSKRLHAQRSLAIDYETIAILDSQAVQFQASIEIDASADPEEVYLSILEKMAAYLSPSVRFYTLEERLAQGKSVAEIFDGPLLNHGFIDSQELIQLKKRTNLYSSDLIREIMDVSGVRMVEYIVFKAADDVEYKDTTLELKADKTPRLDVDNTALKLKKRQLQIQLKSDDLKNTFQVRQIKAVPPLINSTLRLPPGRDRHIARYYSLLQQFPTVYGIGEVGLPSNASEQRKAEAKQLKAYLLFFDQLLANNFTQLAHVRDLFSFDNDQPLTYFAATSDDHGISDLWLEQNNDKRQAQLQKIFGSSAPGLSDGQQITSADWQRQNRFLDHLLARFAEQFTDYSSFSDADGVTQETSENNGISQVKKTLLSSKLELLRAYDRLSRSRGSGYNILAASDENSCSGLEQLLRLKLGLLDDEKLYVIEHILFRPIPDDTLQNELPVLRNAFSRDPYSLQVTVLLFVSDKRRSAIEHFVEQTVRDETPAHLMVYLSWRSLEDEAAAGFYKMYDNWQHQLKVYRKWLLNGATGKFDSFPLRVYRDHLIDWLGIGETNPLRDLAVTVTSIVDYDGTASIKLQNTEAKLFYQGFTRSIADQEFVHGTTDVPTFTILVPDKKQVTLLTPAATTSDFGYATDAVEGQLGSDLELSINNKLTEDSFVKVQAFKMDSAKVQSTIGFTQVTAVLVRPNPNLDLHLIPSSIKRSVLQAPIQVTGGEPGVFYEFTNSKDNTVLGLPVYFPHPDSSNNTRNVGIGQVQVEVDLVVAADGSASPQLSDNVTLSSDAVLSIRAYKAQSGVEVIFTRNVSDLLA